MIIAILVNISSFKVLPQKFCINFGVTLVLIIWSNTRKILIKYWNITRIFFGTEATGYTCLNFNASN